MQAITIHVWMYATALAGTLRQIKGRGFGAHNDPDQWLALVLPAGKESASVVGVIRLSCPPLGHCLPDREYRDVTSIVMLDEGVPCAPGPRIGLWQLPDEVVKVVHERMLHAGAANERGPTFNRMGN